VDEESLKRLREAIALINQAASRTRSLARELAPVELEGDGLGDALRVLMERSGSGRGVESRFREEGAISNLPRSTANQLYAIGLHMLQLAERHEKLSRVELCLAGHENQISLGLTFDGVVEPGNVGENQIWERGLEVLRHRARLVGGKMVYTRNQECGNSLVCTIYQAEPTL
jgi:signal transduction histidine kinase